MKKNLENMMFWITVITVFMAIKIIPDIYVNYNKERKILKECEEIYKKIELEKIKTDEFEVKIKELDDEFQIEKIVRDKLKMVKENEEIYRFINK